MKMRKMKSLLTAAVNQNHASLRESQVRCHPAPSLGSNLGWFLPYLSLVSQISLWRNPDDVRNQQSVRHAADVSQDSS